MQTSQATVPLNVISQLLLDCTLKERKVFFSSLHTKLNLLEGATNYKMDRDSILQMMQQEGSGLIGDTVRSLYVPDPLVELSKRKAKLTLY